MLVVFRRGRAEPARAERHGEVDYCRREAAIDHGRVEYVGHVLPRAKMEDVQFTPSS